MEDIKTFKGTSAKMIFVEKPLLKKFTINFATLKNSKKIILSTLTF